MKYKKIFKIEAEFGSDFQHELAVGSLERTIESWGMFYSRTHKKNKIKINGKVVKL